jgi:arylsulfatase A-like enzyme
MGTLTRRQFNSGLATGLLGAAAGSPVAERPPNVLVIQTDQQRADALGCAGNDQIQTPHLDRLAAQGTRFSRSVSASPSCTPSRGTFQTGLHPHDHGAFLNGVPMRLTATSFAQVFERRGYATGYAGKWHLSGAAGKRKRHGFVPPEHRHGWQEWHGYELGHSYFRVWTLDAQGKRMRVPGYDWEPTWQTDVALRFIERENSHGRPWLFQISYGPPHWPQECPDRFRDLYPPDSFRLAPDVADRFPAKRENQLRRKMQVYYGQVTAVDYEVGRVLEGLDRLGLAGNTIVLFTSDHGDVLGSHCHPTHGRLRWKNAPYASAFRIPLIFRSPGRVRAGQVCDALVDGVDVAPTLLELAGLGAPPEMRGRSHASWCTQGRGPEREAIYLSGILRGSDPVAGRWRGIWDGRWVYAPLGYRVLFDHAADPYERANRFSAKRYVQQRKRMHERMVEMARDRADPALDAVAAIRPS